MNKIVGKNFVTICVLWFSTMLCAGIRLEMRSADGVEQNSAVVGQPFIVEAIIDGVHGSVQAPTIEGLDKFFAKRTGMYMSSINGVSTTKYTYHVRIDQPGNYTIGPARLSHQQQELLSNTLSVTIDNGTTVASRASKNSTKKRDLKVFLRLMVDVDHVVVGQHVKGTLRFYYQDQDLTLTHIGVADIPGFDVKPMTKPIGGTVDVNGIHYRYADWQWDMYPTQAGEFMVPAYSVDYEVPAKNKQMFGGFFMFMGARADRKRVYSNAVKITVDPLPHSETTVHAIGTFESIQASIIPPVAKEGEGMVLTIEINGDGNMEAVQLPPLVLPEELKYYDSNCTIVQACNDTCAKKKYDFVVQGVKSGDWEIPEQTFVYFDIDKRNYVTLKTSPLSVSIQPSTHKTIIVEDTKNAENVLKTVVQEMGDIAPLNVKGPWYPITEAHSISWALFLYALCIPFVYAGFPLVISMLSRYSLVQRQLKRRACWQMRKKIVVYMARGESAPLYPLFIHLFSVLMHQPESALSRTTIDDFLRNSGFLDSEIDDWNVFFAAVIHAAYTQSAHNNEQELCRMAIQWLERLKSLI